MLSYCLYVHTVAREWPRNIQKFRRSILCDVQSMGSENLAKGWRSHVNTPSLADSKYHETIFIILLYKYHNNLNHRGQDYSNVVLCGEPIGGVIKGGLCVVEWQVIRSTELFCFLINFLKCTLYRHVKVTCSQIGVPQNLSIRFSAGVGLGSCYYMCGKRKPNSKQ